MKVKESLKNLFEKTVANPLPLFLTLNIIFAIIIIMRIHSPADKVREALTTKINTIQAEAKRAKSQVDTLRKDLATAQKDLQTAIELVAASELLNRNLTNTYYQHKKSNMAEVDTIIAYLKLVQIEQNKLIK